MTKYNIFSQPAHSGPFKKNYFELFAWKQHQTICGVDEVGRGCLAGPLVTAAVILPVNTCYSGLKDSKILNSKQRTNAYNWIIRHCQWAVAFADHTNIEQHNIYQATKKCMKRALFQLAISRRGFFSGIVIDAVPLTPLTLPWKDCWIRSFPKAESISPSVAAASIIAKVTRDRLMQRTELLLPQYQFGKHKGYGTQQHQEELLKNGQTLIHRKQFVSTTLSRRRARYEQQTICRNFT